MPTKHAIKNPLLSRKNVHHNGNGAAVSTKRSVNKTTPPFAWIDKLIATVPPEAWDSMPTDSSTNINHYLYGAPKRG